MKECGEGRKAPWVVKSEDSCARALEMSSHNSLFVCVSHLP
jgi:hypothetical protein